MDLGTLGGLIGGFVLLLVALIMAASHGGSAVSLGQFIDPPAAILVLGGGLCVVMISVPLKVFLGLPKVMMKLCFNKPANHAGLIETLVKLAETARKEGLLALENRVNDVVNPTLLMGLRMAVDGTRPELIEQVIRKEIAHIETSASVEKRMFDMMGRCGPAFGMIATLLGLILMLGNLDDPDSIGPTMAMALVGTLYGAAVANMVCLPCAEKLAYLGHEEVVSREIILDGVLAIQAGDSPRLVAQKLAPYLAHGKQLADMSA
ncbi:MAG: MotA/TolQ/ExbB proton channel family protein [Pirellulales bacterium]